MHDVWGCYRAEIIDSKIFGMYRKTRCFDSRFKECCNCFYCIMERKHGKQKIQSDINYREQLQELSVI